MFSLYFDWKPPKYHDINPGIKLANHMGARLNSDLLIALRSSSEEGGYLSFCVYQARCVLRYKCNVA